MKKNNILPIAASTLVLLLAGCGAEKSKINEDPNRGVKTSTNGCNTDADRCQGFSLDYPVAGVNFDCSSDKNNHFVTEFQGNVAFGGCPVGDTVTFYIQGETSSKKIDLGAVNLKTLSPLKIGNQLIQIGIQDLAQGLTGRQIQVLNSSDSTYQAAVGIARIFQAIGVLQRSSVAGDVQLIRLTKELKNNLNNMVANVTATDFTDGTYVTDVQPWVNVSNIAIDKAEKVTQELIRLKSVSFYTANHVAGSFGLNQLEGFNGTGLNQKQSIGNMYLITTRQGYSVGYVLQWNGIPIATGNQQTSALARLNLINQVAPIKLDLYSSPKDWINLITQKIQTPLKFKTSATSSDELELYKGTLLSQAVIPANEFMYKQVLKTETPPANDEIYGAWRQNINVDRFNGKIDIYKTNPVTYLDRAIFRTESNVSSGEKYIFPLYVKLIFKNDDASLASESMSIVIDEKGDIRTNRTASNLVSNTCSNIVNQDTMQDDLGVTQYRIGTTGTVNSTENDKSITIRMILANPIFGNLNGNLIGLNNQVDYLNAQNNKTTKSLGVRLNLQNLIVHEDINRGINITSWANETSPEARWINMYAAAQQVYNAKAGNVVTTQQTNLAKRQAGSIQIELTPCYAIQTKR